MSGDLQPLEDLKHLPPLQSISYQKHPLTLFSWNISKNINLQEVLGKIPKLQLISTAQDNKESRRIFKSLQMFKVLQLVVTK